jgi:hypothetical protein
MSSSENDRGGHTFAVSEAQGCQRQPDPPSARVGHHLTHQASVFSCESDEGTGKNHITCILHVHSSPFLGRVTLTFQNKEEYPTLPGA